MYGFNFLPETGIERNLGLKEKLHNRIQEIHDTIGEDAVILDRTEQLQQEKDAEEELTRQLRLEIETLRSPKRIEALATTRLHLVAPRQDEAIVLERVVPPELPASSIVASR